jgi:hypothetical protein
MTSDEDGDEDEDEDEDEDGYGEREDSGPPLVFRASRTRRGSSRRG